jgi:anti-sigma factor RsiW
MTCQEAHILLHALIDDELDAGHARAVETHAASCPRCRAQLREYRGMRAAVSARALGYRAPEGLRRCIEAALPSAATPPVATLPAATLPVALPRAVLSRVVLPSARPLPSGRRSLLKGFAMGSVISTALAACLVLFVVHAEEEQRIVGDVVSAHLRSLQGDHLIDVKSTNQHTVKPWFNGRLELAPPVIDLTAQGFTLVGGRLDYVDGRPVAAIVYQRRAHVIDLFVSPTAGSARGETIETLRGFNVWRWAWSDLSYRAVSDIDREELAEFGDKLKAAVRNGGS